MTEKILTHEQQGDDGEGSASQEITVTFGIAGGKTHQIKLQPGTTMATALKSVPGYQGQDVRIGGKTVTGKYILKDGEQVVILPAQVRGGN